MTRKKRTPQPQNMGRPPIYGVPMIRTFASLRPDQIAWLRAQGDNVSETIRNIIDEAMARDGENPV